MDGKAVRKMIVHPQYLHQASRGQREYGWSKLDMELCFSWGSKVPARGLNQGGQLAFDAECGHGLEMFRGAAQEIMFRFGSSGARFDRGACHLTRVVMGLR